jgi:hypothetical protein
MTTGWWFSPGPLVSSTNKTDRHDINEILLKVALNTIKQTNKRTKQKYLNKGNSLKDLFSFHIGPVIRPRLPYQDFFQALTYIAEKVSEQTAKINP